VSPKQRVGPFPAFGLKYLGLGLGFGVKLAHGHGAETMPVARHHFTLGAWRIAFIFLIMNK
jgi:hypothetical protein